MTTVRVIRAGGSIALLFVIGCSDSVAPKGPVEHLIAADGGGQSGATLDTLPDWLVVRVVDDGGEPLAGVRVIWSSDDETARTIPVDPVTNHDGVARAIAVLGFHGGEQKFHAEAEGIDDRASFAVTATRRPGLKAVSLMNASASDHMCALDAEGRAWCWGNNFNGQLGDGTTEASDTARLVSTTQRFTSLSASWSATCGIELDRSLWCWGSGNFGNGGAEHSAVPVPAAPGLVLTDLDMDARTTCALTSASEAWCWGTVITPAGNIDSPVPVKVESEERWRDISVSGSDRVCAIAMDYETWCWAAGEGNARTAGISGDFRRPQPVPGVPPLLGISVSWYNQCGIAATGGGAAVCWGHGPNGVPSAGFIGFPRAPAGAVTAIASRVESVLALGADGRLWMWGELPCCGIFYSQTPFQLPIAGPWRDFALADQVPYGIMATDSTVYTWYDPTFSRSAANLFPHPVPTP